MDIVLPPHVEIQQDQDFKNVSLSILVKVTASDLDKNEKEIKKISCFKISTRRFFVEYGRSIVYFFEFVKFSSLVFFLQSVACMSFLIALFNLAQDEKSYLNSVLVTYPSPNISARIKQAWYFFPLVSLIGLTTMIYFIHHRVRNIKRMYTSEETHNDEMYDVIDPTWWVSRKNRHSLVKNLGRFVSAIVFIATIVLYWFTQVIVQTWIYTHVPIAIWAQTLISIVFIIVDLLCQLLFTQFTWMETHLHLATHRTSNALKSLLFRIASFTIFMWVHDNIDGITSIVDTCSDKVACRMTFRAEQMLNLFIVDLFVTNLMQLVSIYAYNLFCACICCARTSRRSDFEFQYAFSVSDEYMEILYKQFISNQAMTISPWFPLLESVNCVVSYWVCKYKLTKLCRFTNKSDKSYESILWLSVAISFLSFVFGYPGGIVWIFS